MNHYDQIPPILDQVYKFFKKHAHFLLKDIVDIGSTRRKYQLIENSKKFFQKKWNIFNINLLHQYPEAENLLVVPEFDLMEFGNCCIFAILNDQIIIYSVTQDLFYWGDLKQFFVNGIFCSPLERELPKIFDNSKKMLPDSLLYGLFRSYNFDRLKITNQVLIDFHGTQEEGYLIHKPIENNE